MDQEHNKQKTLRPRRRAGILIAPLALAALALACQGEGHLTSPVISVDLRHKLPAHLQRLVVDDDPTYPCQQGFKIASGEVEQKFLVIWKVLEQGEARFITAVRVDPDGPITGASSPVASAMVGELQTREQGGVRHQHTSLAVTLRASKGCATVEGKTSLDLGTDFAGCKKPPKPKMKLLTPVE